MNRRLFLGAALVPLMATPVIAGGSTSMMMRRRRKRLMESSRRTAQKPHERAMEDATAMWVVIQEKALQKQRGEEWRLWWQSDWPVVVFGGGLLGVIGAIFWGFKGRDEI